MGLSAKVLKRAIDQLPDPSKEVVHGSIIKIPYSDKHLHLLKDRDSNQELIVDELIFKLDLIKGDWYLDDIHTKRNYH